MKKVSGFSLYMKKISSGLAVIDILKENQLKDKCVTNKMHLFLVEQTSTILKNALNIFVYNFSFCYFYHDEIYLSHEHFHEFSLEGLYKT